MSNETIPANRDDSVEMRALRQAGILGRAGPYGNGIYAIDFDSLPIEARELIRAVAARKPVEFPGNDGEVYKNRSGDLPGSALEYREYTVKTPGQRGRGRRRVVIRANGLTFFTACHYDRVPGTGRALSHAQEIARLDEQWRNGFYVVTGLPPALRSDLASAMASL